MEESPVCTTKQGSVFLTRVQVRTPTILMVTIVVLMKFGPRLASLNTVQGLFISPNRSPLHTQRVELHLLILVSGCNITWPKRHGCERQKKFSLLLLAALHCSRHTPGEVPLMTEIR